jgi:hypothetical protein
MEHAIARSGERTAAAIFTLFNLPRSSYSRIEPTLKRLKGVREVSVDYVTNNVLVRFDPAQLTTHDIRGLLQKIG